MKYRLTFSVVLRAAFAAALLVVANGVLPMQAWADALRPDLKDAPLRGYNVRQWSLEEGAPSRINAITQTPDGFLWLGGVDGLFRFDGMTFERIGPPPTSANRIVVARLLAARDGSIWIGLARRRGMLVWRDGALVDPRMPNPSREVNDIAEAPDGAIWVTRGGRAVQSLARWHKGTWTEIGPAAGMPAKPAWHPLFARDGTLWLTLEDTVIRRRAGQTRFEPTGIVTMPRGTLAEAPDGTIWLSDRFETRAIARNGKVIAAGPRFSTPFAIRTLFDREASMWGVTWSSGAFRARKSALAGAANGAAPRLDRLTAGNGLLSDPARAVFEDRDGNIWIGSELGLNLIRRVPIVPAAGIAPDASSNNMLAVDRAQVAYIANDHAVYVVPSKVDPVLIMTSASQIEAICAARDGGIWVVDNLKVQRVQAGGAAQTFMLPKKFVSGSCAEDRQGRLWLPALQSGLFMLQAGQWQSFAAVDGRSHLPANIAVLPDGRAAIHFRGRMPEEAGLPFAALTDEGVRSDGVEGLLPGRGVLYTSGAKGLAAPLLPGQPLLPIRQYPWAGSLNGLVQTAAGETWAIGDQGLVRMRTADLDAAFKQPGAPVPVRSFDFHDGLASFVQKSPGAQIVAGGDGRIWFATRGNVLSIDPATIRTNLRPPDLVIKSIRTGLDSVFPTAAAQLPAGVNRVEIEYTATNLAMPHRVQFRYRLVRGKGLWIDAGNRRTVAFSDLGPGDYRFELLAANEDGVWGTQPAVATFSIARAFHQTWWFRTLAVLAVLGLLYLIYSWRLREVSSRLRNRMLARNSERERIARELHDTMIQGVQGLILRFQAVADRFSDDPAAQAILVPALERAEEMLVEGRERVIGLRSPRLRDFSEELARQMANEIYPQDRIAPLKIVKRPRPIAPGLIDDLLAVLGEALTNAATHSQASRIEVGIKFGAWSFSAYVRDNGTGIQMEIANLRASSGHFGLIGMKERLETVGGRLVVESAAGFGTEVQITLPARIAYRRL